MKTKKLMTLLAVAVLGTGLIIAADKEKGAAPAGVPATYPLKKCPVSDEALGEMGKPVKVTHEGTDVYLCCKACIKDFNKEPAKYVEKVKAAQKK
jgi:YHS domain-containing protein